MDHVEQPDLTEAAEQSSSPEPVHATEEQQGGRILTVNGKPVGATDLAFETRQAFQNLWDGYAWIGPLVEGAILACVQRTDVPRAVVCTPWGNDQTGQHADSAKHQSYVEHVKAQIEKSQPWLWQLFDAARAIVAISPDSFTFAVGSRPGAQWDAPNMTVFTALTPFAEEGEPRH